MATKTETLIKRLLNQYLSDVDNGIKKADINEILRIKAAIDSDRPTVDLIMTVILNEYTYLNRYFDVQSDEEFQAIMRFLESFHEYTKQELLSKAGTYKEAATMEVGSE